MKSKVVISLQDYINMGGEPEKGLKLFTNPCMDSIEAMVDKKYFSKDSNFYTLIEVMEDGVKVEETKNFLGTGCLFLVKDVTLA